MKRILTNPLDFVLPAVVVAEGAILLHFAWIIINTILSSL